MVCPELELVHKGFAREDLFTCVHEQFLTETAAYADIVLPATMFLEHDDFYTASGHTFFQVTKAVIEPPGECRENHYVISELAKRLGAKHRGFDMTPWEIMDEALKTSGMWDAETNWRKGGQDFHLGFETSHFLDGFAWPDKKFRFKPDWAAYGPRGKEMPVLPDHFDVIDNATADKPFRMVAAPARTFLNSTFTETPSVAEARGPADGDDESRGLRRDGRRRGRPGRGRQRARQDDRQCQAQDGPAARRGDRRGHLAQPQLRDRHRHQCRDLGRAGLAQRRRGVPRHRRLDQEASSRLAGSAPLRGAPSISTLHERHGVARSHEHGSSPRQSEHRPGAGGARPAAPMCW